eukprot:g3327.t1
MRDIGTTEEVARVQHVNSTKGDPNGFVNAEFGCIQSRTINNFQFGRQLQLNGSDQKISRYNVDGSLPFYVDLESFHERIREWDVRSQEVRYTSRYPVPSPAWQFMGHLSIPPESEADFNSSIEAESRRRRFKDCAKQLLLDRRRVRSKAIDVAIAKGHEALLDSDKVLRPQTDPTTILTAAVSSIVAAVTTTSRIGTFVLEKLETRGHSHRTNVRVALSIEFVMQLVFSVPLHLVVVNEVLRQRSNVVHSIVFITTTEYEEAPGLTSMTGRDDADPYHLINMVQASREANPDMLILAVVLEFAFLVFAIIYVLVFRRRQMIVIQKSVAQIEVI